MPLPARPGRLRRRARPAHRLRADAPSSRTTTGRPPSTGENRQRDDLRAAAAGDLGTYLASLRTELAITPRHAATTCRASTSSSPRPTSSTSPPSATPRPTSSASPPPHLRALGRRAPATVSATSGSSEPACCASLLLRRESAGDGGGALEIDSFLLSCRALGRGLETAVMNHLKSASGRAPPPSCAPASTPPPGTRPPPASSSARASGRWRRIPTARSSSPSAATKPPQPLRLDRGAGGVKRIIGRLQARVSPRTMAW